MIPHMSNLSWLPAYLIFNLLFLYVFSLSEMKQFNKINKTKFFNPNNNKKWQW